MMVENIDLLANIARAILDCEELDGVDLIEVTAIFGFDEDGEANQSYGYAYGASGAPHAATFLYRDVKTPVNAYADWLRTQHDEPLVKLLFQFNRKTGRFKTDFEYENAARWQVTPRNIDTIVEELRPKLGR